MNWNSSTLKLPSWKINIFDTPLKILLCLAFWILFNNIWASLKCNIMKALNVFAIPNQDACSCWAPTLVYVLISNSQSTNFPRLTAAKNIATTIARSQNRVYLDADTLFLNIRDTSKDSDLFNEAEKKKDRN